MTMGTVSFPSQHIQVRKPTMESFPSQHIQVRKPTMASPFLFPSPFVRLRASTSISVPCKAHRAGPGDADKVLDELLNKYGKVVYSEKSPSNSNSVFNSLDDDSECLQFALTLAKIADEVKAEEIRLLYVKPLVYWTRFFVITTAYSNPQINAIGSKMRDIAEKEFGKVATGDPKPNAWTLIDFGDVVVHIFMPQQRTYYNLEEFYGNAIPIELPFDNRSSNQSAFRSL